ncbi:MAG: acetyl-CoA carboxylase biotin carboxyl carrier protein [Planctomycetota bacterium]
MIDIRKLKELVRLMVENDLTELDLQDQEETVSLKRGVGGSVVPVASMPAPLAPAAPPAAAPPAESAAPAGAPAPAEDGVTIESPMVGTFYASPNPDSDVFVKVGDAVSADTVVCLVEAMKVFNEIKAETSGTVAKCLVENGQAVEFGQPLFLIKPN